MFLERDNSRLNFNPDPLMGLPLFMLSLFFNRPYIVKNLERKIWSCFVCICLAKQRAWYKVMATPHRQDPQGSGRRGIRLYTSFSSLVSANWVLLQQQQSVGNGTGAMCHQHKRHGSLPTSAKRSIREDENGKREQPCCSGPRLVYDVCRWSMMNCSPDNRM